VRGPAAQLAAHSGFVSYADGVLRLTLAPADEHLKGPAMVRMLATALQPQLGVMPEIRFALAEPSGDTLHVRNERQRDARQAQAEEAFMNDPDVRVLLDRGARVAPDSIRPLDDA
jgi:DNA polymerase-3 subunit gamma/tau